MQNPGGRRGGNVQQNLWASSRGIRRYGSGDGIVSQTVCPSLFFSTAPAPAQVACALEAFDVMEAEPERREQLWKNVKVMQNGFRQMGYDIGHPHCGIISVVIGDELRLRTFGRRPPRGGNLRFGRPLSRGPAGGRPHAFWPDGHAHPGRSGSDPVNHGTPGEDLWRHHLNEGKFRWT